MGRQAGRGTPKNYLRMRWIDGKSIEAKEQESLSKMLAGHRRHLVRIVAD